MSATASLLVAVLAVAAGVVSGAPTASDPPTRTEVTSLPGVDKLPSKMYTGHITLDVPPPNDPTGKQHMFYWLVEAQHNPETAPVVMWYQGGPGASSLFGLLVEFGPLLLNVDSLRDPSFNKTGVPVLQANPYTWSKDANLVVVDNPSPVGFSYCSPAGPAGSGKSCGAWNDSYAGVSDVSFVRGFFTAFPEYQSNPFFVAGESYAGVYVPVLVRGLLALPPAQVNFNLTGFLVGDGCLGTDVLCGGGNPQSGPYYTVDWLHGHGAYSQQLHYSILRECPEVELRYGNMSAACKALVAEISNEVGAFDGYNFYDMCADNHYNTALLGHQRSYWGPPFRSAKHLKPASLLGGALNDYACPSDALGVWLNLTAVRKALNVATNSSFNSGDNGSIFTYKLTEPNLLPFYLSVVQNASLRVMVYNGDVDPGINSFITQDLYLQYLSPHVDFHTWRPWTVVNGSAFVGGYVVEEVNGVFQWVSVKGSGHMVPEFKAQQASVMLDAFLWGESLPSAPKHNV